MKPLDAALPWLVPLGLVALWQASSMAGWLPPNVLPAPSAVLEAGWRLTANGALPETSRSVSRAR